MNSDAEMLQAMEHLADQIDRLAAMLDECVTLTRAGVPISARSIDRYAAELERLTRERAAKRPCASGRTSARRTRSDVSFTLLLGAAGARCRGIPIA